MTYQELYQLARQRLQKAGVDSPGVDAALLTQGFLNLTRTGLALHGEETPTPEQEAAFLQAVEQVRSALETYCTMEITRTHTSRKAKRLFRELRFNMEEMKEILDTTQSIQDFCTYDFQFHVAVVRYLENQQFSAIFDTFMYRMQRLAQMSLSHPGRMEDTYNEHLAILEAMEAGDTAHIYDITLRHMDVPRGINLEDL